MLHKTAYLLYTAARKAIRTVGLTKVMRGALGPIVGRFILRLVPSANGSLLIHGHRMVLASGDKYPPIAMSMGRYEEKTTQLVQRLIKPGMVVVDVGAHVGYYTLLAARAVGPFGKVYAFEPEPHNHALLLKNIELNRYGNIVVEEKAVSCRNGRSTLYLTALDSGRHSLHLHSSQGRGHIPVATMTLDGFFESEGWPRVDLIKIDVEGSEKDVLDGMERLFQKSNALTMILEFNPSLLQSAGVDVHQFPTIPASLGFKIYLIDEQEGLVPLDQVDIYSMTKRLLAEEFSVNLYCLRQ